MASVTHAHGLDAPITIKVQYEGITRRTKMPLRDMIPRTLENNIRAFLQMPLEAELLLERYSDSAGAYVYLDPKDIPIYKQLYRAAKAKSKLKLRVARRDIPQRPSPRPVTVEDEPEVNTSPPTAETPQEEKAQEQPQELQGPQQPQEPQEAQEVQEVPEAQEPQQSQANISPAPTPVEAAAPPALASDTMTLPYRSLPTEESEESQLRRLQEAWSKKEHTCTRAKCPRAQLASEAARVAETMEETPPYHQYMVDRLAALKPTPVTTYLKPADNPFCPIPAQAAPHFSPSPATGTAFAVCCNACEQTIPNAHYHCSTCDDGDFDLCQACVDQGVTCKGEDHWLIKRATVDGRLVQSTTETIAPKSKSNTAEALKALMEDFEKKVQRSKASAEASRAAAAKAEAAKAESEAMPRELPPFNQARLEPFIAKLRALHTMRTCNCCVQEFPEYEFLHCDTCDDFDLCQPCFSKGTHGHHPKHGFAPAVKGTAMPRHITMKMAPGRNQRHHAICDGCDRNILGVRHKCLDCPDWDYCSKCIATSKIDHPGHRFVPVYEQLEPLRRPQSVHIGICCDGPMCSDNEAYPAYIHGTRYKCAICNDLDFCANCYASPLNVHNVTHPMIVFKTPVRGATIVTTEGERTGHPARKLGDLAAIRESQVAEASNAINRVQTIVDVKPTEPAADVAEPKQHKRVHLTKTGSETKEVPAEKEAAIPAAIEKPIEDEPFVARFVEDTIRDGTILPPNHVFEQTWFLRNEGQTSWPAGCSVKFVGGDYMGHVDSNHPAGISELVSASESTVCYHPLAPGQEFPFTVLLRTPARAGNIVSYWRLTAPSGHKFGDRLWCDVSVRNVKLEVNSESETEVDVKVEPIVEEAKQVDESQASSQMIFPKLDKESPVASIHEATTPEPVSVDDDKVEAKTESGDEDWDLSESGFMTDEEYDILDASDEEYLEEQKKKLAAK